MHTVGGEGKVQLVAISFDPVSDTKLVYNESRFADNERVMEGMTCSTLGRTNNNEIQPPAIWKAQERSRRGFIRRVLRTTKWRRGSLSGLECGAGIILPENMPKMATCGEKETGRNNTQKPCY